MWQISECVFDNVERAQLIFVNKYFAVNMVLALIKALSLITFPSDSYHARAHLLCADLVFTHRSFNWAIYFLSNVNCAILKNLIETILLGETFWFIHSTDLLCDECSIWLMIHALFVVPRWYFEFYQQKTYSR